MWAGSPAGRGERSRRRRPADEKIAELIDRITEIEVAAVIRIAGVQAIELQTALEQILEDEDSIAQIDRCIDIGVPSHKTGLGLQLKR